ncbi:MAG TPA: DUF6265 family protein [Flavobacterium sp.]|jgi:hypothetical protein
MRYITLLAIPFMLLSCQNKERKEKYEMLAKAEWLLGDWENLSADGRWSESWVKANDSTYNGQAFFIRENDTLHQEQIVLSQRGLAVNYTPTVKGQNGDKPVQFNMTSAEGSKLIFENPAHNYPQKISYLQITKDSLVADISGIQQGKPSAERFAMTKVN